MSPSVRCSLNRTLGVEILKGTLDPHMYVNMHVVFIHRCLLVSMLWVSINQDKFLPHDLVCVIISQELFLNTIRQGDITNQQKRTLSKLEDYIHRADAHH